MATTRAETNPGAFLYGMSLIRTSRYPSIILPPDLPVNGALVGVGAASAGMYTTRRLFGGDHNVDQGLRVAQRLFHCLGSEALGKEESEIPVSFR